MANPLQMSIMLTGRDSASGIFVAFGQRLRDMNSVVGLATGALVGIGVAAVGFGVASVKAAGDFQQSMTRVQALAGLSKQQTDQMSQSILDMSVKVGQSPKNLADALYPIASAGFRGSDALNILQKSAESAATSGANMTTIADGLTTTLNAFGLKGKDATMVVDQMTRTVADGKITWQDYASSIGKVALTAHSYKLSLGEMNAALATLSNNGFNGAANSANGLNNYLSIVDGRTDTVAKRIKSLGIAFDENKFKTMDLSQQVQYLSQTLQGHDDKLQFVLGGSRLAAQAFLALRTGAAGYAETLKDVNKSEGATGQAFQATEQTYNQQMAELGAAFDVLKIKVGSALLPIITQLVKQVTPFLLQLADWVTKSDLAGKTSQFLAQAFKFIGDTITVVSNIIKFLIPIGMQVWDVLKQIGAFLVTTFKPVWDQLVATWKQSLLPAWNALVSGIRHAMPLIGAVVAVVAAVLIGIIRGIIQALAGFLTGIIRFIGGVVMAFSGVVQFLGGLISFIVDLFTGNFGKLGDDLKTMWDGIVMYFKGIFEAFSGLIQAIFGAIWGYISGFVQGIVGFFQWLFDKLIGHSIIVDLINGILGWFTTLLNLGPQTINMLVSALTFIFTGLVNTAVSWGTNLIQGFINGITSMIGNVEGAAGNIINSVKKYLGFASPAEAGPGAHLMEWGPGLVSGFSEGITRSIPLIESAVNLAVAPVARLGTPLTPALGARINSGTTQHHNYAITVNAPGRSHNEAQEIAQVVIDQLSRQVRRSGGLITMTSGGRAS